MATGIITDNHAIDVLVNIQTSSSSVDGTYFHTQSTYFTTVAQERLAKSGNVVSLSLRGTIQGPMSVGGTYSLCYLESSLWPIFPFRVPLLGQALFDKAYGVVSIAASNGQISVGMTSALASGSTFDFYLAATYLTAQ